MISVLKRVPKSLGILGSSVSRFSSLFLTVCTPEGPGETL